MDDDDVTEREKCVTCFRVHHQLALPFFFFPLALSPPFFLMMVQYFISVASAVRQTPVLAQEDEMAPLYL